MKSRITVKFTNARSATRNFSYEVNGSEILARVDEEDEGGGMWREKVSERRSGANDSVTTRRVDGTSNARKRSADFANGGRSALALCRREIGRASCRERV